MKMEIFNTRFGGYCYMFHWKRTERYSDCKRISELEVECVGQNHGDWDNW